ncbi:Uncharacterized protein Zm00014a_017916 [Zea mays]|uniref:VPS37 C-terminal domain-containing protein n=1 Tax=Zea mays TaxID=4577 RepID=A0A3L6DDK8_MAIZE|nr:Uncharacterized protein Zm00014a_017916 [Zea mays]
MVDAWWPLLGAAFPALVAGQFIRTKRRRDEEQRLKAARGREKSSDEVFVCERVCTSKRMLNKVGAFSKDPIPETCVTVCGVSELDACADACARTVCVNQHQVPNWNDVCLKRFLYTMSWRFPLFGSQQQQSDPNFQDIPTQSWYPTSVVGLSSSPATPTSSSSSPHQRASNNLQSSSRGQPSPAEAAEIIAHLKDKRCVTSLERRHCNLQCTIIRTTQLAAAQDRLTDLERQKDDIMRSYSPAALLDKLQTSMAKLDEESEELQQKFLAKDIDFPHFVQKYKKLRTAYHKQALLHLAGQT